MRAPESSIKAAPAAELLDSELLDALKDALKKKFSKPSQAFDQLGGSDDGKIEKKELVKFLKDELELGDNAEKIFKLLDKDKNGYITKGEFKQFGQGDQQEY